VGLREIKKERTREALVEAALHLIREKGFEQTTVAEIAAAAGMSTRTFFLHFPAKEDVLLVNSEARADLGVAALAASEPGESVADAITRAVERMVADTWGKDMHSDLAGTRAQLIATEPALQARVLQRLLTTQVALADALLRGHPEMDPADAAAVVGAVLGAVNAAAEAALRGGADPAQVREAMLRAPRTAARHLTDGRD
jgi:AcrR family transcriptional regulator